MQNLKRTGEIYKNQEEDADDAVTIRDGDAELRVGQKWRPPPKGKYLLGKAPNVWLDNTYSCIVEG